MICGFTCDDLAAMFKELKTLGVVVRDLSDQLNKVVRRLLSPVAKRVFCKIGELISVQYRPLFNQIKH